ncbi:MAG TPA: glycosyl hydrolase [Solirubrobacteraceae bacterium]|nr:glycosyl hydrolase [Solirubrobacteraceae bacterium]
MRRHLVTSIALLLVLGVLSLVAAAPSQAIVVGLADQQAATFADPKLTALPVAHARLSVAWDALQYGWQRRDIDAWMRTTRAAGMKVVVTFGRSRTRPYSLPSTGQYRSAARDFMRRYRSVREYSPWNEPNLALNPRNRDPHRIAAYYRTLRELCQKCTLLGADVVDTSNLGRWMSEYVRVFPSGRAPKIWGLHNYGDVNSTSRWGTQTMLRLAPGQIWFTETGAIISRRTPASSSPPDRRKLIRTGAGRAAAAMSRVFTLAAMSPRISRVYIYHWRANGNFDWDSAMLSASGAPRPSFTVFAHEARAAAGLADPEPAQEPPVPESPSALPLPTVGSEQHTQTAGGWLRCLLNLAPDCAGMAVLRLRE